MYTITETDSLFFGADDLRFAAEFSSNPDQYRRAASWAIKTVFDTGVPDSVAAEYYMNVARQFI